MTCAIHSNNPAVIGLVCAIQSNNSVVIAIRCVIHHDNSVVIAFIDVILPDNSMVNEITDGIYRLPFIEVIMNVDYEENFIEVAMMLSII